MSTGWLSAGVASVAVFLATIRAKEGRWLAPSASFVLFYFSATFVAPLRWDAPSVPPGFYDASTLPLATAYAFGGLWALYLGYLCLRQPKLVRKSAQVAEAPLLTDNANGLAKVLVLGLITAGTALQVVFGLYSQPKGATSGGAPLMPALWMMVSQSTHLMYPLFLAIVMTELPNHFNNRRLYNKRAYLVLLLAILIISSVSFSRQIFLTAGIYLFLYYHARVGLKKRHMIYVAAAVVAISATSQLRKHGIGAAVLSQADVETTFSGVAEDWSGFLLSVAGAVAGQEVFTHVLARVPDVERFKYGGTYLDTLIGLMRPRVFTGEFDEDTFNTPAHWYKRWYSPDTVGHGFDFSMLAEAYMNFGPFLLLFYLLLGYILARLSRTIAHSESPFAVFSAIITTTALCFGIRNDSNSLFKTVVFYNLPIWLFRRCFLILDQQRARRRARFSKLV